MSDTPLPAPTSDRDEVQYLRMNASDALGEAEECAVDLFNLVRELRMKMHTLFQEEETYEDHLTQAR